RSPLWRHLYESSSAWISRMELNEQADRIAEQGELAAQASGRLREQALRTDANATNLLDQARDNARMAGAILVGTAQQPFDRGVRNGRIPTGRGHTVRASIE